MYDERTEKTLAHIKEYYGDVPNTYLAMADAGVVSRVWSLSAPTFFTGEIKDETKRICAAVVGHTIGMDRLVEAHYMILKRMGWSRDELDGMLKENYPERMSEQEIKFAKLAKTLSVNPLQVDRELFDELCENTSKQEVAEIISLIAFVRYTSTYIAVYGEDEHNDWINHLRSQN